MPLILERNHVLSIFSKAAESRWVIPAFGTENLTTTEAVLAAVLEHSQKIGKPDLPIIIAVTNQYSQRSQSVNYTHTKRWDIGLKLFLSDIDILTSDISPFHKLNVMILLDHTQWDRDAPLLQWDMRKFSMIMFDASSLPLEDNILKTAEFVAKNRNNIIIEGACDEIVDSTGKHINHLTNPHQALQYFNRTGVDFIVANLGTEHRASQANLNYNDRLAREISGLTGPRLVLHGTSSVSENQIRNLFFDGIAKVNIWTALERDSAPVLFKEMIKNASKIIDNSELHQLIKQGLLGNNTGIKNTVPLLSHYTTLFRQDIVFNQMKEIVSKYLDLWYN